MCVLFGRKKTGELAISLNVTSDKTTTDFVFLTRSFFLHRSGGVRKGRITSDRSSFVFFHVVVYDICTTHAVVNPPQYTVDLMP